MDIIRNKALSGRLQEFKTKKKSSWVILKVGAVAYERYFIIKWPLQIVKVSPETHLVKNHYPSPEPVNLKTDSKILYYSILKLK